jgi:enoyl-CoA hydratase/carnithine racemase
VNGVAMGGGFEIALACDLIVASETATFALPEPRVGLAALAGGIHRLPRQIGLKNAMGMLLTGRRVSAAEGLRLGFVNEVVPPRELMSAARRWADQILECAPLSVRASKQAAMAGLDLGLEEACNARSEGLVAMVKSQDFVEGPRAFAEKRAPRWKGR